jgi:hypothetical protein
VKTGLVIVINGWLSVVSTHLEQFWWNSMLQVITSPAEFRKSLQSKSHVLLRWVNTTELVIYTIFIRLLWNSTQKMYRKHSFFSFVKVGVL